MSHRTDRHNTTSVSPSEAHRVNPSHQGFRPSLRLFASSHTTSAIPPGLRRSHRVSFFFRDLEHLEPKDPFHQLYHLVEVECCVQRQGFISCYNAHIHSFQHDRIVRRRIVSDSNRVDRFTHPLVSLLYHLFFSTRFYTHTFFTSWSSRHVRPPAPSVSIAVRL